MKINVVYVKNIDVVNVKNIEKYMVLFVVITVIFVIIT